MLKTQLDKLDAEKVELSLKCDQSNRDIPTLEGLNAYVESYLTRPSNVWSSADAETKVKLQWFQFPEGITGDEEKFGTAKVASIFNVKTPPVRVESSSVDS